MQHNVNLNGLPLDLISTSVLDWGTDISGYVPQPPDIVLAADCVYYEPSFPLLIDTVCFDFRISKYSQNKLH